MKPSQKYLALQILKMVGIGATFTAVSVLSPTFLPTVIKKYLRHKPGQPYKRQQIQNAVNYLKRKKFIAFPAKPKNSYFYLTKAGKQHLLKLKIEELEIKKTAWDKRWRLVTFDIPESATSARFSFRRILKKLGFYHFQRSVFIIPYACEKQVQMITEYLKIQAFAHFLTTDRFASDQGLIRHFRLK